MTANRKNAARTYTDMAAFDAHVIQPEEYNEIPELTDEQLARGWLEIGGVPVKRGRPALAAPKQAVTLRLDADVLAHFRSLGQGWQTKINEALRKSAELKRA